MPSFSRLIASFGDLHRSTHSQSYEIERLIRPILHSLDYIDILSKTKMNSNLWILRYQKRKLGAIDNQAYLAHTIIFFGSTIILSIFLAPFHSSIGVSAFFSYFFSIIESTFIAPHIERAISIVFLESYYDTLLRRTKMILYSGPAWILAERIWKMDDQLWNLARKYRLANTYYRPS
ncbi:MAG: hypothetical protein AAB400_00605 [Patescibacteria group bacterium]